LKNNNNNDNDKDNNNNNWNKSQKLKEILMSINSNQLKSSQAERKKK